MPPMSDERKQQLSKKMSGRKLSEEHIRKVQESKKKNILNKIKNKVVNNYE
jgi:uncharacterized protein YneF (UPF0154 family)